MIEEARLQETESGFEPAGEGWFVVNVGDTKWMTHHVFGSGCTFESRANAPFPELGINISTLSPGQPLCLYHRESAQEDFLLLSGEAILLVEGEERPLKAWDFFHCPAGTDHVIVGAGTGPAIVLAVGKRPDGEIVYPRSVLAAKYGASAEKETPSPEEAYAPFAPWPEPKRPGYWADLPWSGTQT